MVTMLPAPTVAPSPIVIPHRRVGTRAYSSPSFHKRWDAFPIGIILHTAVRISGSRIKVICECDPMAYKYFVLDCHAFAYEGVTRDFATGPYLGAFLHLDEGPDLCPVPDLTTIKVCESEYAYPLP